MSRAEPRTGPVNGDLRQGFVYERVPHVTLKSIANNSEIDVIWDKYSADLDSLRSQLVAEVGRKWQEWEIPRDAEADWSAKAKDLHRQWWAGRIERQREIDASIAAKAENEYLFDRPYDDFTKVRVAGPFTVESLSPHRVLGVDENDQLLDSLAEAAPLHGQGKDFATMILENLKTAGVQQAHKADKIMFSSVAPWPGEVYLW